MTKATTDIVSTKRVAQMLGVSEATVKRWADGGTLACVRTSGGHRKFRLRDVRTLITGRAPDDEPTPVVPMPQVTSEQREARRLALSGDAAALTSFVTRQRQKGLLFAQIFDRIIAPSLHHIGDAWELGQVTAAHEHGASNAVIEMLARVRPHAEKGAHRDRGVAVCACLGDEFHDLAVRMVGVVLAGEGYRSVTLAANVPATDLAQWIASQRPAVLALSSSACAREGQLRGDLAIVASAAAATRTRVVVGGVGFHGLGSVPGRVLRFNQLEALREHCQKSFDR